jgi:hypothetical protein
MEAQISFWETFSTGSVDGGELDPNLVWFPFYEPLVGKEQAFLSRQSATRQRNQGFSAVS